MAAISRPQPGELVAEKIGHRAPFDHPARVGGEAIERGRDGPRDPGAHLRHLSRVFAGVLRRSQRRPQRRPCTVGRAIHGVLQQLGQKPPRRPWCRAVLAAEPRSRLHELAHFERCPPVAFFDSRAERDPLGVERTSEPLRQRRERAPRFARVRLQRALARRPGRLQETRQRRRGGRPFELARVGKKSALEHLGQRVEGGVRSRGLLRGERPRRGERDHRIDQIAERALDVTTSALTSPASARSILLSTPTTRLPAACASASASRSVALAA